MTHDDMGHESRCCVDCKRQAGAVLLAVSDDGLRETLRLMVEDAGYGALEAHSGLTAFTLLLRSQEPLVVLLDSYLRGTNAAEQLLTLAGGPLERHRFLLLTSDDVERLQGLRHLVRSRSIPVLSIPFEFDDMLHEIAEAHSQLR